MEFEITIYYYKKLNPNIYFQKELKKLFSDNFMENYVHMISYLENAKETDNKILANKIFFKFNSDNNPLSSDEYQRFIIENRLHTSMSVGDIIEINKNKYVVLEIGFYKILKN